MIKQIDKIILLGTSHVAKQSAKEIEEAIKEFKPEVVGIELDIDRFRKLMSENKKEEKTPALRLIKEIGLGGYLFAQIAGFVQSQVGKSLNIDPGVDMKTAYLTARDNKIPVSLIDINIRNTLKKFSKLKFRKKISMFTNLFTKSFKKEYRDKLHFDVKKGVPDEKVIVEMLKVVEKEVPDLYKILIEDRNKYMSNKLLKLNEKHEGYILAVIGAGHVEGMYKILKEKLSVSNEEFSFSFTANLEEI